MNPVASEAASDSFLPELEGLRGVAAWSLVLYHCWIFSSGSMLTWNLGIATVFVPTLQSAVTLFFCLSGFLLYRPFARALAGGQKLPSIRRYLRNRALRILPAYWFILIVTGLVLRSDIVAVHKGGNVAGALQHHPATFVADLLLVQNYLPHAIYTGILPAWSLCLEVAFYLLLPLVVLTAVTLARRIHRPALPMTLVPPLLLFGLALLGRALVALFAQSAHPLEPTWSAVAVRSFPANADLFAVGMVAAVVFCRWERDGTPAWVSSSTAGRALAYLGLPAFVFGHYFLPRMLYEPLVALLAGLLILRVLALRERAADAGRRTSLLTSRVFRAAGRTSYGVFLWHYPILCWLVARHALVTSHTAAGFAINLLLVCPIVGVAAAVTYRLVERPALLLRRSHGGLPAPAPYASGVLNPLG